MTQKLNAVLLGLLLMGVLGQPALADAGNRDHGLSPEELAFVFGDPNADGFEVLSPEEMEDIEGDGGFYLPWMTKTLYYVTYFAGYGWSGIRAYNALRAWQRIYPPAIWGIKFMKHGWSPPAHRRIIL